MTATVSTSLPLLELARQQAEENGRAAEPRMREALEALQQRGFPHVRNEQWRYFGTSAVVAESWQAAEAAEDLPAAPFSVHGVRIEVINGRMQPLKAELPDGVEVVQYDPASAGDLPLGSTYDAVEHPFASLNLLLTPGVIVIRIAPRAQIERPIHLHFASSAAPGSVVSPRVLILADEASHATILETWSGAGRLLVLPVVEILASPGSTVDHVKVLAESDETVHIGNYRALQQRDSVFRSALVTIGGGQVRHEINAALEGEGAEASLDGLWMLTGTQKVDHHTTVDHVRPHTSSRELYKGVLAGKSNGIFEGLIIVRPEAQKISSQQTNNNLLLSRSAVADSKPQLEIHADDVRCAHGSTIGQLDESSMFYLQSRGIDRAQARRMLTLAFAGEMIDRLPITDLREPLREMIIDRIPHVEEE